LIKTFEFSEDVRRDITLSAGCRLNPATNRIELKANAAGVYDTDPLGFNFTTWLINPETAKQWLGFQAFEVHPRDVDADIATPIRYRLGDGTTEYHWNGAAWVASSTLWNTEAEVAAGMPAFPIAQQKLRITANLSTDDSRYTPALSAIKVLYATDVVFQEDLIYRSLVRSLRETIRPVADWPVTMLADGATFDLDSTKLDTPYNVTNVVGAYATDTDPNRLSNLLSSYNPTTKVVTLVSPLTEGDELWLQFQYEPEVSTHTSRDYIEIGKVPAIVLSDINISSTFEVGRDDHIVLNKTSGASVRVPGPKQQNVDFVVRFLTDKARDLQRLQEAVREWIRANPLLRARGIDERYSLQALNHFDGQGVSGDGEVHAGRIRLRVLKALFYDRPDEDAFATVRFTLRGPPDLIVS
jgi:hypothetical protein